MRYRVDLSALAVVRQTQYVEAVSREEAEQLALEQVSDHVWHYDDLWDGEWPAISFSSAAGGKIDVTSVSEAAR